MAFLSEEQIQDIRNKARIEEIIGRYLPLQGNARSPKCVCPFHDDHDPSLSISLDKQIFKCFVCGVGGNVFHFVQHYEKIPYIEAVYKVADMISYPLEKPTDLIPQPVDPYPKLHAVLEESIRFSQYQLQVEEHRPMLDYLLKRGIDQAAIEQFGIGYMPRRYPLHEFLQKKGFALDDMVKAGIVVVNEHGTRDVFYDRITIPIHDQNGHPVGFTARTLNQEDPRKYINTAETPIYHKSDLVFNYHRAKQECRRQQAVVVTEGPMDAFAFDKAGIAYTVATLGTACTKEQMRLIKRLSHNIILAYDGDTAGQNAIYKAGKQLIQAGCTVSVLNNDSGLDPDEIIRTSGAEALLAMVKNPLTWMEFVYRYWLKKTDLGNYSRRKEFVQRICEEIQGIHDELDRSYFLERVSKDTGFAVTQLSALAHRQAASVPQVPAVSQQPLQQSSRLLDRRLTSEYEILYQIMSSRQAYQIFQDELGYFPDENNQRILMYLMEYYRTHETAAIADFLSCLPQQELRQIVLDICDWEIIRKDPDERVLRETIQKIKSKVSQEQADALFRKIQQTAEGEEKQKLILAWTELKRKIQS